MTRARAVRGFRRALASLPLMGALAAGACDPRPAGEAERTPGGGTPRPVAGASRYSMREVAHAPPYFLADGWAGGRALWGLAGSNPVVVSLDAPEYAAWGVRAWSASLDPGGDRLAWLDERGIRVGRRGEEPRLLLSRDRAGPGAGGDLGGPLLWSPDGRLLLARWSGEGVPALGVVRVETGEVTPVPSRADGALVVEAALWLDADRLLLATLPSLGLDGREPLGGGLAVFDARDRSLRTVERGRPGISLVPLAPWSADSLLVGVRTAPGGPFVRYRVQHTGGWAERPAALPAGYRVAVHSPDRIAILTERAGGAGDAAHRVVLWDGARATPLPALPARDLRFGWSPAGDRLFLSAATERADSTGALETRYRTWVVER